jgi:ParB family chromosome partitioning protein
MTPEQECEQGRWSAPEHVEVESIVVEQGRLPIDEGVVKDLMATIAGGDVSALPPVHLWRKQPGANPILVAGRNRLEAHKRSGREVITARVITGETPQVIRAVQLIEIEENLNRRQLSPALRVSLTKQRKAIYEEEYPDTKRWLSWRESKGRQECQVAKCDWAAAGLYRRSCATDWSAPRYHCPRNQ